MSTPAYVDLMFAWGHARLGDADTARKLVSLSADRLTRLGEGVHDWLLKAFTYRVEQAIAGQPHDGSWPDGFVATLDRVGRDRETANAVFRFIADRLRTCSRILEPVERVDPYQPWKKSAPGPEWYRRPTTAPGPPGEWLQEKYADLLQLADHAAPGAGVGSMVHPNGTDRFVTALVAAQRAGLTEQVDACLTYLFTFVAGSEPITGRQLYLLLSLSKALIWLGRKPQAAALADEHRAAELAEYQLTRSNHQLVICLGLAAIDLWLGRPEAAAPALDWARRDALRLEPPRVGPRVIGEYFEAIAWAPWPDSFGHLQSMLDVLPHFPNVGATADWYSVRHLEIIEPVVFAITTYHLGPEGEMRRSMSEAEIASRREALVEVRGKLMEWGQKDWDPVKSP